MRCRSRIDRQPVHSAAALIHSRWRVICFYVLVMTQSCVLVLGDTLLVEQLSSAVRSNGYEALGCRTPLDAIQLLERHSSRIGYAVLAAEAWEVGTLLASEYPQIQSLVLSA